MDTRNSFFKASFVHSVLVSALVLLSSIFCNLNGDFPSSKGLEKYKSHTESLKINKVFSCEVIITKTTGPSYLYFHFYTTFNESFCKLASFPVPGSFSLFSMSFYKTLFEVIIQPNAP